jgi:hypothetical protein
MKYLLKTYAASGLDRRRFQYHPQVEQLEERSLLSYGFRPLTFLGDPVPGGGGLNFTFDFEPGQLNNRGQLVFGADMTNGGEGVFFRDTRQPTDIAIARTGDPVPEGGGRRFGPLFLGTISINDAGTTAFVFHRENLTFPSLLTLDAALYRWSPSDGQLRPRPELLPGTPAPGGGTFRGFNFRPAINNRGTIAFGGLIPATIGPGASLGLGLGLFQVDAHHNVSKLVRPGDPAPGGKTFDFAQLASINNEGDMAFEAHVREDTCITFPASFPEGPQLFCAQSVYLRNADDGRIRAIARQGDPAPGGGRFSFAFAPALNDEGQIAYIGALPASPAGTGHAPVDTNTGIFLFSEGRNIAIARPGTVMPGGGKLVSAGIFSADVALNNEGVVAFDGVLDTDVNGDGKLDTALFTWAQGRLTRVAGTGTVIPGVGTIKSLHPPDLLDFPVPFSFAVSNDRNQIVFQATLTNGRGVMLLATPTEDNDGGGVAGLEPNGANAQTLSPGSATALVDPSVAGLLHDRANGQTLSPDSATVAPAPTPNRPPVASSTVADDQQTSVSRPARMTSVSPSRSYLVDQVFADFTTWLLDASTSDLGRALHE